jgi:uncharacterized protein YndB with AHSA1/START domain/DNA-binding transcriptional ArsR family regulator
VGRPQDDAELRPVRDCRTRGYLLLSDGCASSSAELDRVFRALADATRRDIVPGAGRGAASISELAARYDMSFAAVQKHVAVLEGAGLVTKQPQGRERIVRGNPERIARARELLARLEELWRARFSQLDACSSDPITRSEPMPITSVTSDAEALTLTVVGDYPVPVERLWEAYADPRQLERFWGPETWPATFTRHDMAAGRPLAVLHDRPGRQHVARLVALPGGGAGAPVRVEDGFAHEDGRPNEEMPTMRMVFTFEPTATGSRFTSVTYFPSLEAMEQLVEMGMLEGLRSALGQLDDVLADLASFAADRATGGADPGATRRSASPASSAGGGAGVARAPRARAAAAVAARARRLDDAGVRGRHGGRRLLPLRVGGGGRLGRFGFEGELLESEPPHRAVTTERMIGMEGPGTVNEMTLTPVEATARC